ncbi:hypothetical protein Hanom_Chr16g01446151 [Helianthus anomalus]
MMFICRICLFINNQNLKMNRRRLMKAKVIMKKQLQIRFLMNCRLAAYKKIGYNRAC